MTMTPQDIAVVRALLGVAREQGWKRMQAWPRKLRRNAWRARAWRLDTAEVTFDDRHGLAVWRNSNCRFEDFPVTSAQQVADLLGAKGIELVPVELTSGYLAAQAELARRQEQWDEIAGSVWLYTSWRWFTRQLTTEQKDALADAVDRWCARIDSGEDVNDGEDRAPIDRWWRDKPAATRKESPA